MSEIVVAVLGDGASTRKNTVALLNDWHAANKITAVAVSGNEQDFHDAPRHAADWALQTLGAEGLAIIVDGEEAYDKESVADYVDEGVKIKMSGEQSASYIVHNRATHIFLAFPEENTAPLEKIAETALRAGKQVFDLTDGLFPIALDETEPSDSTEPGTPTPDESLVTVVSEPKDGKEVVEPEAVEPEVSEPEIPGDEAQQLTEPSPVVTNVFVQQQQQADLDAIVDKVLDRLWQGSGVDDLVGAVVERFRERLA